MAVIRSLTVRIGTDLSKFEKGMRDVGSKLEKMGRKLYSTGTAMTNAFTVPIVAAAAALGKLMLSTAEYGDKISTLAAQTGIGVQALQELEYVAIHSDTEFEAMTSSMSRFTLRLREAMNPASKVGQIFQAMNISMTDSNGAMKSRETLFMEAIQATGSLGDETMQALVASELFGRSFADLLPLVKLGANGMAKLKKEYQGLGIALSDEQINTLDNFNDKIDEMKLRVRNAFMLMVASNEDAFKKIAAFLETKLIPAFENLIKSIKKVIDWFMELDPSKQKAIMKLIAVLAVGGPILTGLGLVASALGNITKLASDAFGAIAKITGLKAGLSGVASSAAGIGAGIFGIFAAVTAGAYMLDKWRTDQLNAATKNLPIDIGINTGDKVVGSPIFTGDTTKDLENELNKAFPGRDFSAKGEEAADDYFSGWQSGVDDMLAKLQALYSGAEDGTEKMADGMDDFTSSIRGAIDALRQQTSAFANFSGLFDIFERKHISGNRLMNRMKAQLAAMAEWQNSLVALQAKGISEQFLQTLRMQGPGAVDYINALATLAPEQLAQYEGMYNEKLGIGATQAGWARQAENYIENQINLEITGNQISSEADVERVANSIIAKLRYEGVRI